jgi:hypothetical protein
MESIVASGPKRAEPELWDPEFYRAFLAGWRLGSDSWVSFVAVLLMGGALLAACAAGPTGPVANSEIGPALANDSSAVALGPIGTGELRFFVLPPDALVGAMARADQTGR